MFIIWEKLGEKGILFTTARKYKGLEAEVVIIIDIDRNTFKDEESKRVLHVAASRAKYFLSYISHFTKEEKKEVTKSLSENTFKNPNLAIKEIFDVEVVEC